MIETETGATFRFSDILTISKVFARSINIKRDFNTDGDDKVAGYIPTLPAEDCLKAMAESIQPIATDRVRLVYGPYGGGKSNLGLVIARLMRDGVNYHAIGPVLERIANGPRPAIASLLKSRWGQLAANGPTPFLPVVLAGNEGSFHDAMLAALRRALEAEDLAELVPKTAYSAARARIKDWRLNHEEAYKRLEALLAREEETVDGLEEELKAYRHDAYGLFCRLHPQVSYGAVFYSEDLSRVHDVYEAVARLLPAHGYAGIFVVWDEFGSQFEEACRLAQGGSQELKEIEQFAEMCQGSRVHQVHFLALAHRSLAEYADLANLGTKAKDDWKRISGRFASHNLVNTGRERDAYEVLGRVIQHDPASRWREFLDNGARAYLDAQATEAMRLGLFNTWDLHDLAFVTRTCYPLHPAMCYILPRLSSAIAQNERTMFTFTSYDEEGSMREYIDGVGAFPATLPAMVGVDRLFTYFSPALREERSAIWDEYTLALYEAGGESVVEMDRRILQVMTIWSAVRERVRVLTVELCRFALVVQTEAEHNDFTASLERLKDLGVVYQRESDSALLLAGREQQSITQDLATEVKRIERTHDPVRFLREHGDQLGSALLTVPDIELTAYHRQHKTRRVVTTALVGVHEAEYVKMLMATLGTAHDQVDGLVLYMAPQSESEYEQARVMATTFSANERVLVVVPPAPLSLHPYTVQLEALRNLSTRAPYNNSGSGLAQIANDRRATFRRGLEDQVRVLLRISHRSMHAHVYSKGQITPSIVAEEDVEDHVSSLFAAVYTRNLAIDDEQMSTRITSKQVYAGTAKTRRNVIDRILRFDTLSKAERESLGFGSTSAEYRIVRGLLVACGYLDRQVMTWTLGRPKREQATAAMAVYDAITDNFFSKEGQASPVKSLIQKLSSPPFGLYSAPLPLLIAVAIRERASQLQFLKGNKVVNERETPLSDVLLDMCFDPAAYAVVNRPVSSDNQLYLALLMEAIGRKQSKSGDPIAEAATALRVWVNEDVTAYARKTARLSAAAKALRDSAMSVENNPFKVMVEDLPRRLNIEQDIGRATVSAEARDHIRGIVTAAAQEVATCHNQIDGQVIDVVADIFTVPTGIADDVFHAVSGMIVDAIDCADPIAVDAIRPQMWDVLTWVRRDHTDLSAAFGDLALTLVNKTNRSQWTDSDIETVRARLRAVKSLIDGLPTKPEPLTPAEEEFLRILAAALGGDNAAANPLDEATRAGMHWYKELSPYAKRTTTLRQDAELFRDALNELGKAPARQLLLHMIPHRLDLIADIALLPQGEAADRVRRRLQELITRLKNTSIKVDLAIGDAVRASFKLTKGSLDEILGEVRVHVEGALAAADRVPLSPEVQRFVTVIRRDDPADTIFRALGSIYVGAKEDARWSDGDVAHATEEIRRIAGAIATIGTAEKPRKYRIALAVNGHQSAVEMQYHEIVENVAVEVEHQIMQVLRSNKARPEAQLLGVAKVLQRMLEKQGRR